MDWYNKSISKLINDELKSLGLPLVYNNKIPMDANIKNWQSNQEMTVQDQHVQETALNVLSSAFSKKYGQYDYADDIRSAYPLWFKAVKDIFDISGVKTDQRNTIAAMAANYGLELAQIFNSNTLNNYFDIVDIGTAQITRGKKAFPQFNFHQGSMETPGLVDNNYDIYLNLRAIQSSGVNQEKTIAASHQLLKENGVCIISIANGYLMKDGAGNKIPKHGLIKDGQLDNDLAFKTAESIKEIMTDQRYKHTSVLTCETEIFVFGYK